MKNDVRLCPVCRQPVIPPRGPEKAALGALGYAPDAGRLIDPEADQLFSRELRRLGLNVLELWLANIWMHTPGDDDDKHLLAALKPFKSCKVVLLFGTQTTKLVLGLGISGIMGLKQKSGLLPGVVLLPCPAPAHVLVKPLGEFRLALEIAAKELKKK